MKQTRHYLSAFVAANIRDGHASVAYSVYEFERQLVVRVAKIDGISEHRALLMATWSAVSYCKRNMPLSDLSVYSSEKRTGNELSAVWLNLRQPADFEDSDRIESIIHDCAQLRRVAFGLCGTEETGVMAECSQRMKNIIQLTNTNNYGNNRRENQGREKVAHRPRLQLHRAGQHLARGHKTHSEEATGGGIRL